jgi:hypothetical protein
VSLHEELRILTLHINDIRKCILEPGYYEDGEFGIRLETAVVVVNASTPVCEQFLNMKSFKELIFKQP